LAVDAPDCSAGTGSGIAAGGDTPASGWTIVDSVTVGSTGGCVVVLVVSPNSIVDSTVPAGSSPPVTPSSRSSSSVSSLGAADEVSGPINGIIAANPTTAAAEAATRARRAGYRRREGLDAATDAVDDTTPSGGGRSAGTPSGRAVSGSGSERSNRS
jgi:hypothetical protein